MNNFWEIKVVGSEFEHCSVEVFKQLPLSFVVDVIKVLKVT